ncbi:aminoglycoside 6'-N-acetyltransferase [Pleionea sp. CnH1-48]|uniref:aminoglycoside 6'-N-acetyltransferase n=1 Tax=Pleionea sp. CnH1-48 TaxID=2954494 RepID=UPI002096F2ED|nr:aminoglycoside 6'-N-acetyltransferase [Pleionea sp. CnH1-48]MCO7223081.1 GNAT family N-acetyltransferase [Pleionea sp. CnH1-48]
MKLRKAKENDIKIWAELRNKLWPDSINTHLKELKEYFSGNSIDIVEIVLVESEQGEIIGFMELNIRNYVEGSRQPKVPYVEAWYVEENYRSQGIGTALMKHAEQWAKSQGFNQLASDTELINQNSIRMHKKLGFDEVERIVCFIKEF